MNDYAEWLRGQCIYTKMRRRSMKKHLERDYCEHCEAAEEFERLSAENERLNARHDGDIEVVQAAEACARKHQERAAVLLKEHQRLFEALEDIASSVADEAYRQIDVSGQWMLDRARRALVSTERERTQNGYKDTQNGDVKRWRDAYHKLWGGAPVEVRMPDGALDEIVGYGGFHVEHLDKNLWFFDLGGCRFNVHGFDIRLQPIETDCWDNERERLGDRQT